MNLRFFLSLWLLALMPATTSFLQATIITWTNQLGGNWSGVTNWDLNRLPVATDNIVVSASGTYAVALDANTGGLSLTIGGGNGFPTLLATNNYVYNFRRWNILSNGVLSLRGNGSSFFYYAGAITNAGTILIGGETLGLISSSPTNGLIANLSGGLLNLTDDSSISANSGNEFILNQGTVRKSGGSIGSTGSGSYITPNLTNYGLLDVKVGTLRLNGNYNLANGTINIGINNATNIGAILFGGAPTLSGALSVTLNNGFQPTINSNYTLLTYTAHQGSFANIYFPSNVLFKPVYGSNSVSVSTLNLLPNLSITTSNQPSPQNVHGIYISWPSPSAGFTLQQSYTLPSAGVWQTVSNTVSDDGTNRSVLINTDVNGLTPKSFFRLIAVQNP